MKHLCCSKIIISLLILVSTIFSKDLSVGFYYGSDLTSVMINEYDWLVVDPSQNHKVWAKRYPEKLFAYVSVGEIQKYRNKDKKIPKSWVKSKNKAWGSQIANLKSKDYQRYLITYMKKLRAIGYKNFFLDTLDSIFGVKMSKEEKNLQKKALGEILKKLRLEFKDAKIIANRGVEVMDKLCSYTDAFAIESLYQGIDTSTMSYKAVSISDRTWIKSQLDHAKACGLKVIAIDYVSESKSKLRLKTAKKISDDGYIPFVTDINLKHSGRGKKESIKREILCLYDSKNLKDSDKVYSNMHLMVSMPLEYLGYIPVLKDIRDSLPYGGVDRYSGVVVWAGKLYTDEKFFNWVKNLINSGQKIVFINSFGFELDQKKASFLDLNFSKSKSDAIGVADIVYHDKMLGYELPPFAQNNSFNIKANHAKVLCKAKNDEDEISEVMAITSWGGYGIAESVERDIAGEPHWIVDPFLFLKESLRLKDFPVPTPTTQNGKRLSFIHIDGDGFIEKARFDMSKYASEILYEKILKKYPFPHSISVIEGEIGEEGLYPNLATKMQNIAKQIYKLPFVEAASHTYSHPFKWQKLKNGDKPSNHGVYHLPIKGYSFDLKREVKGSINFVDKKVLEGGKKCKLFFWSGDCLPYEDALYMCEKDGIRAINGGDTTIDKDNPWLGRVAPFGIQRGAFWQTYVGEQNENIYTNDWLGPYWGYRRAIDTFKITEKPRRLKPVNIYYHFYSASKTASLDALYRVYEWVSDADLYFIYTSEYIDIAQDFYATSITKDEGVYFISNRGYLKSLRVKKSMGYPDLKSSIGVIGFKDEGKDRYIHLDGRGKYKLVLTNSKQTSPYLVEANANVKVKKTKKGINFRFDAHVGVKAKIHTPKSCKVLLNNQLLNSTKDDILEIDSKSNKIEVQLDCK